MQYPNGIVGADVVLINGLEPSDVVVGVRHQMDIDFAGYDAGGGVVSYVSGVNRRREEYSGENCSYGEEVEEVMESHGVREGGVAQVFN